MPRNRVELGLLLPLLLFLGLFVVYPLLRVAYASALAADGSLTLANYVNIAGRPQYLDAIRSSIVFAGVSTALAAVVGTLIAYFSIGLPPNSRRLLLAVYALPLTLSGLVVAFAFIVLLGRGGIANIIIREIFGYPNGQGGFDLYSWPGLVIAYMFFEVPMMTLAVTPVFENLDGSLIEAARNLGASRMQQWRFVILPGIGPGIVAGMSVVFAVMMGAYGMVLAITGLGHNLLALQIYSSTSDASYDLPQSAALSVVLVALTSVALVVVGRLGRRLQPQTAR